ncbi:MAG TPA: hypothetical protein PKH02_08400 [Bacteroidales bacterium]|nr:hypothetical protein [Bacteroidales bacterium]HPT12307.1 hypothetical protein [Bacteroidales bacterium]
MRNYYLLKKLRPVVVCVLLLLIAGDIAEACTSFIISGKYTADGRPILYKNRDTDNMNNSLAYFSDGRYDYIGLVNGDSTWDKMVWGGYNSVGFAIINTAAYNNNTGDTTKLSDLEGVLMKKALQYCRTLADFEALLDTLPKPLGVDANFGVIDAYGGAAYYETGNFRYVKYDVNDPAVAPQGFLVRTNHSMSGDFMKGLGHVRYNTAEAALKEAVKNHRLAPEDMLNAISRNLSHSLTGTDLAKDVPDGDKAEYRFFIDFIPRRITSAVVMIVGAKDEEDVSNAVMWTVLGFPLTSVAVPVWISAGNQLPVSLLMTDDLRAPICDDALMLKERCFPLKLDGGQNYINLSAVINDKQTGIMQLLRPAEHTIFEKAGELAAGLENGTKTKQDIIGFYKWIDGYVDGCFQKCMSVIIDPTTPVTLK